MSELAEAGHGVSIAVELDPTLSPGVFTDIPEVMGDVNWPVVSLPMSNVTAHNDGIDYHIVGVPTREPFTFGVHYAAGNAVHEALRAMPFDAVKRGWRSRGPAGSSGVDEVIASGYLQSFGPIVHPAREGPRTANVAVQLSGLMKLNTTIYGA